MLNAVATQKTYIDGENNSDKIGRPPKTYLCSFFTIKPTQRYHKTNRKNHVSIYLGRKTW